MSRIALRDVNKRFGEVVAVRHLTLEIEDKEFLVLLGPSGCGKSTVLRLIAGLEEPTSGDVLIDDEIVNDVEAKNRDIAMVFQSYALYPHMTVRRNIEFPLRTRKVPGAQRHELVAEAARWLDLEPLLERRPSELSGGQRQRVALARAIVRRPRAFLMDEPLSNLDAMLRVRTRAELIGLHQQLARTFIYVTHDQVEAMTMATRIAVINEGALQQVGPPQGVYDRPANTFVALLMPSIARGGGTVSLALIAPSWVLSPWRLVLALAPTRLGAKALIATAVLYTIFPSMASMRSYGAEAFVMALGLAGMASAALGTTSQALLQRFVPVEMRGRVFAL